MLSLTNMALTFNVYSFALLNNPSAVIPTKSGRMCPCKDDAGNVQAAAVLCSPFTPIEVATRLTFR